MEVKELLVFDDLDIELIETLIRVFSTIFKIKRNVVLLNRQQWAVLVENSFTKEKQNKVYKELDELFGKSITISGGHAMYLNPRILKRQWAQLVATIIHELLHIRFPEKGEEAISILERSYIGRYDYVLKSTIPNVRLH
ncbi:hypothetical protein IIB34_05305 [PVC group bacterium]|nr:hypothetical protein [PVC group bacterium]